MSNCAPIRVNKILGQIVCRKIAAEFDILRVFCSVANQNAANHGADVRFKKSRVRDLDWLLSLAKTKTESCE